MAGDCSRLQLPDCKARDGIPLCAPLRGVVNSSDVPIRIEGWYEQINLWVPLVPRVDAESEYVPFAGALWLPKSTILRSVSLHDQMPLTVFGAVGEGITVVQNAPSLPSADRLLELV